MSIIDDRPLIAYAVQRAMETAYPHAVVTKSVTTSGCPVIRIVFKPGEAFNITITRARK